jgi:uncharacterized protein YdcH (DUF465 family)
MMKTDRVDGSGDRNRSSRIEELRSEHARLEMRLAELERHLSLSPDEQRERAEIKKAKLQLKDTLLHLQRDN